MGPFSRFHFFRREFRRGCVQVSVQLLPLTAAHDIHMESEDWEEEEPPQWFEEILTGDGQDWDHQEYEVQRQWNAIRSYPKLKRELEVASLARRAMYNLREEASELKTSMQETTQRVVTVQKVLNNEATHNTKKKRTIEAKLSEAEQDAWDSLSSLTHLQKKKVLRTLAKRVSEESKQ